MTWEAAAVARFRGGRYEITSLLQRGVLSVVFRGRDHKQGTDVALKLLPGEAQNTQARQRFTNEAHLAMSMRHPGVIAIRDFDEAGAILVMEFLSGGTLRQCLQTRKDETGGLPLPQIQNLARELLGTLAFVHSQGIVHGDLSPRNILFRDSGQAVIGDFGCARRLHADAAGEPAQEFDDRPAGTPAYMAPEMLRGGSSTVATDLFSLGAILWEGLTGRPMRTHDDLLAQRLAGNRLPPSVTGTAGSGVPELQGLTVTDVAALTVALAAESPNDRPADALAALERIGCH